MFINIAILFSKIIENMLATLRLIVVANGKKKLGAILQGIVTLIWIFSASLVIVGVNKDILKIIFFCIGSIIGSYLGSVIEERIALGSNILMCIINEKYENEIKNRLSNYQITTLREKYNNYSILLILLKRKEINKIGKIIKTIDNNSILISEKAKTISNIV